MLQDAGTRAHCDILHYQIQVVLEQPAMVSIFVMNLVS